MTTRDEPAAPMTQASAATVSAAGATEAEGADAARETIELPAISMEDEAEEPADAAAIPEAQLAATAPRMAAVTHPLIQTYDAPVTRESDPAATTQLPIVGPDADDQSVEAILDEVDPDWAVADQPTIQILQRPPQPQPAALPRQAPADDESRRPIRPLRPTLRPAYLETGEPSTWPPRHTPTPASAAETLRPPSAIPRPTSRPLLNQPRIPSPSGRQPQGSIPAAYSDPRMRRLVELRLQRGAHKNGQRAPGENPPVAQLVRQWWADLAPSMQRALEHQHEARASGVYPIPAHEATSAARLGDAFGRVAAAVRDLSGRAQAAAAPALNKLHERAEHAAQALVDRLDGGAVHQQAPFLGPGRVAVFFQQGITVGQAQRLLMANQARPMRLIPRRHGFLTLVRPGQESTVGEALRQHPFVRDVVYLEYDDNGQPLSPRQREVGG
jgi:hypothetical protein